MTKQIRSIRS